MTTIAMPLIGVVVAALLLAITALGWGADSRPGMSDDHRR
jgi:hypothetical protein